MCMHCSAETFRRINGFQMRFYGFITYFNSTSTNKLGFVCFCGIVEVFRTARVETFRCGDEMQRASSSRSSCLHLICTDSTMSISSIISETTYSYSILSLSLRQKIAYIRVYARKLACVGVLIFDREVLFDVYFIQKASPFGFKSIHVDRSSVSNLHGDNSINSRSDIFVALVCARSQAGKQRVVGLVIVSFTQNVFRNVIPANLVVGGLGSLNPAWNLVRRFDAIFLDLISRDLIGKECDFLFKDYSQILCNFTKKAPKL